MLIVVTRCVCACMVHVRNRKRLWDKPGTLACRPLTPSSPMLLFMGRRWARIGSLASSWPPSRLNYMSTPTWIGDQHQVWHSLNMEMFCRSNDVNANVCEMCLFPVVNPSGHTSCFEFWTADFEKNRKKLFLLVFISHFSFPVLIPISRNQVSNFELETFEKRRTKLFSLVLISHQVQTNKENHNFFRLSSQISACPLATIVSSCSRGWVCGDGGVVVSLVSSWASDLLCNTELFFLTLSEWKTPSTPGK